MSMHTRWRHQSFSQTKVQLPCSEPCAARILGGFVGSEGFGCIFGVILVILDDDCALAVWAAVPRVLCQLGATRANKVTAYDATAGIWDLLLDKACTASILCSLVGGES